VTVPGIQVPYTPYLGRTARGQVIISTRLEPLKPRPQPGGAEQGLDLRDYSTLGVTICWLLWGLYYQRVGIYSPRHSSWWEQTTPSRALP